MDPEDASHDWDCGRRAGSSGFLEFGHMGSWCPPSLSPGVHGDLDTGWLPFGRALGGRAAADPEAVFSVDKHRFIVESACIACGIGRWHRHDVFGGGGYLD